MEKRRTGLRLAAAAAGLVFAGAASACEPGLQGTRLESPRFVLAFQPEAISVSQHFALDIAVCAKSATRPEGLKVDAQMPEHRHGMNYAAEVKATGPGHWRAEGLMFHMPGKWEFVFEVRAAGKTDRMASSFQLSEFSREEIARILPRVNGIPPSEQGPARRMSHGKIVLRVA